MTKDDKQDDKQDETEEETEDKTEDKIEEEIECECTVVPFNILNQKRYGRNLQKLTDDIADDIADDQQPKPKPRPKSIFVGSDVYRELGFIGLTGDVVKDE